MVENTSGTLYHSLSADVIQAFVETSSESILAISAEGLILDANPISATLLDQPRSQLIGQPLSSLIGMDVAVFMSLVSCATWQEVTLQTVTGRRVPVNIIVYPGRDPAAYIVAFHDLTPRKTKENELQRTTARLQHLITNLQGGILVEDETRHIVLVNIAFCSMFGIPAAPEDLVGTDCSQSAEQVKDKFKSPDEFVRRVDEILAERQPVFGETLELRNGRVFERDYSPVYDKDEYVGHLWHYHDISDEYHVQKRWEHLRRLEEANREFIRLFLQLDDTNLVMNEVMALAGYLFDVSRVYVFHFRENERILDNTHEWCAPGVTPEIENLKGLHFDTLVPSFFPLLIEKSIIACTHISELPDDIRAILEPQSIQSVMILPLYYDNRLAGFIGFDEVRKRRKWLPEEITTVRIISESYSRALEREQTRHMLIEARDEALRMAQLRSQFVANTSHEIRTPLTGTLGMLELLLETELDELQREFATEAFNSSSRLLTLINDLLDFSKLEAGQIVLEAVPVDLRAIATEVRMTLMAQVKNRPVEIRLEIDDFVPYRIYGDATRLRQVLMNLMGNAVKFTREGAVSLRIQSKTLDNTAQISFMIEDTGIGIAPQNLERIFESFVQADGSTTRKYGGSGLGLAISRQLVGLMGGKIHVSSILGQGSVFEFVLKCPVAETIDIGKEAQAAFSHLHVLVIDPNRTARYVLTQQLETWGVHVTHTDTIENIMRLVSSLPQSRYDLTLMRGSGDDDALHAKTLSPYTEEIVFFHDRILKPVDNHVSLVWPIDQPRLYNLLLQASEADFAGDSVREEAEDLLGHVLIAEDYALNVALIKRALNKMPITMDVVSNGQEALEALEKNSYQLVLMDIHMPVMDGLEATRIIRAADKPYRDIPILAITASVTQSEQSGYLSIGMNEVISKPFSLKHLRTMVRQWLS